VGKSTAVVGIGDMIAFFAEGGNVGWKCKEIQSVHRFIETFEKLHGSQLRELKIAL
jgi:hypothetical protein